MDLTAVEREKTQEMELRFPGEDGWSLLVLLSITGTTQQTGCPRTELRLRDRQVGSLYITVRRATGLPKLSGEKVICSSNKCLYFVSLCLYFVSLCLF